MADPPASSDAGGDDAADAEAARLAPHARALATVLAFLVESGAERVAVLLDAGAGVPVLVEGEPGAPLEVTLGDEAYAIALKALVGVEGHPLTVPRAAPGSAMRVDTISDEVHAPIGVLPALADGVLALARVLGGRTVASADFATDDSQRPLTVAAREGEGVVLSVGDTQFAL